MKNYFAVFFGALLLLGVASCSKPSDLPNLVSCEITVTNGGTPINGVRVSMKDESSSGSWSIHGMTNSSGAAKMSTTYTSYTGSGVPAGKYKVAVDKEPDNLPPRPEINDGMPSHEAEKLMQDWEAQYAQKRIIPEKLAFLSSTPFTVEVNAGSDGKFTIDIAEHKQ
ncbi:MAG: carboxypeptidase-like regulatory domain-containing protein [Planctomycetaceae bacterium]|nr:carboxypeptidase-like regulatory domain-containing protein [Planctomycetaceae bacterium]